PGADARHLRPAAFAVAADLAAQMRAPLPAPAQTRLPQAVPAAQASLAPHPRKQDLSLAGGRRPRAKRCSGSPDRRLFLRWRRPFALQSPPQRATPAAGQRPQRRSLMQQRTAEDVKELPEITTKADTRDILSHATMQAEHLEDYFLVDIDAHVTETQFWPEIIERIDNDVIRQMGQAMMAR